ncbi:MAG: class III extradiol ring-cleavage dioxygenase [Stappiaceae bacterium]
MLPSLFVPHGAPDLPLSGHPAAEFLKGLSGHFKKPDGIVIVSAHWCTRGTRLTAASTLETIHDFGGFPAELYELQYPARSSPELVGMVSQALESSGMAIEHDPVRGLDHGAWVPLLLAFPEAEIPLVQLSLDMRRSPAEQVALGEILEPLRRRNILIIGSGGSTHNLRAIAPEGSAVPDWANAFDDWINETLQKRDYDALAAFETDAPNAAMAHPTAEHLLPLLVAAGAGRESGTVERLHHSFSYGSIGMSAWAFGS